MTATERARKPFEESRRRAHAALRAGRAATAERWLRALEAQFPGEVNCQWLLGVALLDQDKIPESVATLERVLARAPDFAHARVDLARAYRRAGRAAQAREEVRRVLENDAAPSSRLARVRRCARRPRAVRRMRASPSSARGSPIRSARASRRRPRRWWPTIARKPRNFSRDPAGPIRVTWRRWCGLAAVSLAADRPYDAERLLRHALKQSAHVPLAWRGLGPALIALGRVQEAEAAARRLLKIEPENPQSWITIAARRDAPAAPGARRSRPTSRRRDLKPDEVRIRLSIGHVQKTLGRRSDSEASYKAALAMDPGIGEAYWSLADLKNYTFSDAEIAAMQRLLASDKRERANEAQLHFALGKAFEQRQQYAEAFAHYAQGNALRRLDAPFDIEDFERRSARIRAFFDPAFFAAARRRRGPEPRADLHRRAAALGFDAGRADPRQPLARGRHHGAAEHHHHRAPVRRHGRKPRRLSGDRRRCPAGAAQRTRPPLPRGDRAAALRARALHRQAAQ